MDLPRYQSHKQVGALRIVSVDGNIISFDEDFPVISVEVGANYQPVAGDYYVKHANGFVEFLPGAIFEEDFVRVSPRRGAVPQAGFTTAGMLAAILLCAVCTLSFAGGKGNPAALAKYRAEKAAGTLPAKAAKGDAKQDAAYKVPSAGKWSKPAAAPVSGK